MDSGGTEIFVEEASLESYSLTAEYSDELAGGFTYHSSINTAS